MKMKTLLMLSSSLEFVTGLALIATPSLVAKMLLSAELTAGGVLSGLPQNRWRVQQFSSLACVCSSRSICAVIRSSGVQKSHR
jgi:hypothetical protein